MTRHFIPAALLLLALALPAGAFAAGDAANGRSREWLRAWLSDPHPPTPNPNLGRQDIEDVIAYLEGLGRGR